MVRQPSRIHHTNKRNPLTKAVMPKSDSPDLARGQAWPRLIVDAIASSTPLIDCKHRVFVCCKPIKVDAGQLRDEIQCAEEPKVSPLLKFFVFSLIWPEEHKLGTAFENKFLNPNNS